MIRGANFSYPDAKSGPRTVASAATRSPADEMRIESYIGLVLVRVLLADGLLLKDLDGDVREVVCTCYAIDGQPTKGEKRYIRHARSSKNAGPSFWIVSARPTHRLETTFL